MPDLTQQQYEQLELQCHEARRRFFEALAKAPDAKRAFSELQQAERAALEGRRARREAEVFGG